MANAVLAESDLRTSTANVSDSSFTLSKYELMARDRCDSCVAQARMRAGRADLAGVLQFCMHHGTRNLPALLAQGFVIDDQSDKLMKNTKPDSSAAA